MKLMEDCGCGGGNNNADNAVFGTSLLDKFVPKDQQVIVDDSTD